MYPAGELLMEHGKILNDNSSNAGRHTMEPGETIMKTACWNEAAPSLLSIVCLATLCTAAGYFEARSHNLETSHRHPLVCCALLRRWVSSMGAPETGFLWVVQRSVATGGVKYSEEEKIYCQENIWMRMTMSQVQCCVTTWIMISGD